MPDTNFTNSKYSDVQILQGGKEGGEYQEKQRRLRGDLRGESDRTSSVVPLILMSSKVDD